MKLPKTYYGFPVDPKEDKPQGRRGIALLIAILIIAMMMVTTADMIVTSSVNLQLAVAGRDNLKAEYMAKSGFHLALMLISADWGIDLVKYDRLKESPSDTMGGSDLWHMLNGFPIGGATVEMVSSVSEGFDLNKVNDDKVIDQLGLFDGEFVTNVTDESAKINVNYCVISRARECVALLTALMSCPAERRFLEKKDLTPEVMAARIKDYADTDSSPAENAGYSSESDPYQKITKYEIKNAAYESLDELKLVPGWDDDMHAVFSRYLTVYPYQKTKEDKPALNINTAHKGLLSCLLPEVNRSCKDRSLRALNPAEDQDPLDGVSSKEDVAKRLSEVFCETDKKKADWFGFLSTTFNVEVVGRVGDQERTLRVVVERRMPTKSEISKNGFKGSYQILHYKMI